MARIKVVIGNNEFEAEGDETFLKSLYEDFKLALAARLPATESEKTKQLQVPTLGGAPPKQTREVKSTPRKKVSKTVAADRDLDLRPDNKQSFADFVAEKPPTNNSEKNVISVFYLTEVLGQGSVTIAQIASCYDDRDWRIPADLKNNLQKTASSEGWINTQDSDAILLEVKGRNHVKYDMSSDKGSH